MEHEVRNQESGVRDQGAEDRKDLEDSSVGAAFSRDLALSTVSTPLTDLTI